MKWLWSFFQRFFKDGFSVTIEKEISWTGYTKPAPPPSPPPAPLKRVNYTPQTFLETIRTHALAVEAETGIPWLFAATQAAHESRYGNSRLTVDANNLFGITGDSWVTQKKPVYWIETKEFTKEGIEIVVRRPFRKYADWTESLRDWAGLITRRYGKALEAAKLGDFPGFAKGLAAGGYATDPGYSAKLTALHRNIALVRIDPHPKSKDKGLPGDSVA